jgi:hypothetical protein
MELYTTTNLKTQQQPQQELQLQNSKNMTSPMAIITELTILHPSILNAFITMCRVIDTI